MRRCHKCGKEWVSEKKQPAVKEYCDACTAYLHCCLNCRYHDKYAHNECYIPNTDWVGDREGANFCDEFEFADTEAVAHDSGKQGNARETFQRLFDDTEDATAHPAAKRREGFDKLFGD